MKQFKLGLTDGKIIFIDNLNAAVLSSMKARGVYKENRKNENEDFLKVYRRIGISPFKEGVYDNT